MDEFRFRFPIRVRYNEVDSQGIVFNSRYLEYCDAGGVEYFRAAGIPPADMEAVHKCNMVVVRAELDFLAPARLDDLLNVYVRVSEIGRTSLTLRMEMRQSDSNVPVCRVMLIYVNVDEGIGKPAPVPDSVREAVTALERGAPVQ
ncbi:MAG: acyl-CoA thioesterase [Anaerolineae bacterium]